MDFKQIPIPPLPSRLRNQGKRINDNHEALVAIQDLGESSIIDSPQYRKLGLSGALSRSLVRQGVGEKLVKAANLLPDEYSLVVWDGWRPYEVQKAIFDDYYSKLEHEHTGLTKDQLYEKTMKFVSPPSVDQGEPAPHITGGSVDLGILNESGALLDFGTEFDDFTEKSRTRYYEEQLEQGHKLSPQEQNALENRRLLYHVMGNSGFSNYFEEWWHFDYGNQWWAVSYQEPLAIYGLTNI
ncbi:M15 family metallopeptidase [Pontibacillus marinus]|uniref:M15 family metallopeptidase n=1 Tax=Pontibacillus marinus TaxID=273164 RepID=UPI0003FCB86C|nr:M15 family metallopeptidase [Pontibacillus marinus]